MWPYKQILLKCNAMEQGPAETGGTALNSQKEKKTVSQLEEQCGHLRNLGLGRAS